ncbi:MAG TPA: addiction module toxin RelE [Erwinia persicina]|uniref:Addiction module toxin RelE n=1 Tax=Erwinia persicina TaxID=55211 RepID=A0A4U3FG10_9GAMM|nr:addiction module toxin RelE [Erwinia persicina]HBH65997.1 addiction module toxin RelE [Erwinia persicina]HBH68358.1 addiction module toxin RelE [Erwinia persicina]HBI07340.1 addiction module toxin RelE [Erwinia persicina]HBQ79315.1 addiction module toxin RelE [Erwinia persicina]
MELPQGGKDMRPRELTVVSDRGECTQPTQRQFQG